MFEDAIQLFDQAFNQPKVQRRYLKGGTQTFSLSLPHADQILKTHLIEPLDFIFYPAEDPQAKCLLYLECFCATDCKRSKSGRDTPVDEDGAILKQVPLLALEAMCISPGHTVGLPHSHRSPGASLSSLVYCLLWFYGRSRYR